VSKPSFRPRGEHFRQEGTGRVYPWVRTDASGSNAVGQAGGVLLTRTVDVTGIDRVLSAALSRRRNHQTAPT